MHYNHAKFVPDDIHNAWESWNHGHVPHLFSTHKHEHVFYAGQKTFSSSPEKTHPKTLTAIMKHTVTYVDLLPELVDRGLCWALSACKAMITVSRWCKDRLMDLASVSCRPSTPVLATRSEPARSTRWSLDLHTRRGTASELHRSIRWSSLADRGVLGCAKTSSVTSMAVGQFFRFQKLANSTGHQLMTDFKRS